MSYVPDSYLQAKAAMDKITEDVAILIEVAENRFQQVQNVSAQLEDLTKPAPVGWIELVQYIDAEAVANPSDEEIQTLKREKDKIVSDFQAYKTALDAKIAAFIAV